MKGSHIADHGTRPIDIVDGDGAYLIAADGRRYLDFLAGWCVGNLGWKRREIQHAMHEESSKGVYVPPMFRYQPQEDYATSLVAAAPNKALTRAYRVTSGSEAVETAIKCARAATGKPIIVSFDGVYHGHTYGAAALGDACVEAMGPCPPGFLKVPLPHPRYGASPERAVAEIGSLLSSRDDIAAFISEPVFSNAGVIVPPEGFYKEIESMCRRRGVLFCMDEVATGFGRCGKMFASELWGLSPDIICLGKGLTGGFAAMGATLVTEEIFEKCARIPTYSSFGWLPSAVAAATASLNVIMAEKLWMNAEQVGYALLMKCKTLEAMPNVAEARGIGLLIGIEMRDPDSGEPSEDMATAVQDECAKRGLIVETAGHAVFISPPLIITEAQAATGFAILEDVIRAHSGA